MVLQGKVVGGQYVNATIAINRKGELALTSVGFKRTPNLTAEWIATWEKIVSGDHGATANAISDIGQAVTRAGLPGPAGKAASAAVTSTVDSVMGSVHTVRVDWADGKRSMIRLTDKQYKHLELLFKDRQIATAALGRRCP